MARIDGQVEVKERILQRVNVPRGMQARGKGRFNEVFRPRPDLCCNVSGDVPSDLKRAAKDALKPKIRGLLRMVSINMAARNRVAIIVEAL